MACKWQQDVRVNKQSHVSKSWLSRLVARSLRDHFNISGDEATVHDLNGRKLL